MDYSVFVKFCEEIGINVSLNEPMNRHTSFKTGGNADIFVNIGSVDMLCALFETAKALSVPTLILGKGSNLLVSDRGIEGAVLSLSEINDIEIDGDTVTAGAGASLSALCVVVANAGLSGLEFAYGIPGSVGGALYMNAGAYGGEMADVVNSAKFVSPQGFTGEISAEEMDLGYRTSAFKTNGNIITEVSFKLTPSSKEEIWAKMNDFMERRKSKQPLEYPSAGSTFKRPAGYFAGALIEENNLKGVSIGGAMVSEKHAGFIINYNNATTDDILKLIGHIKATVLNNNGVQLETEVIYVGRE